MTYYYAGIGSRETPDDILAKMRSIGARLAKRGFVLRSGAADGADSAFEQGCVAAGGQNEIWLPWAGFNNHALTPYLPTEDHLFVARTVHPAWANLKQGPQKLHARNIGQVLGMDVATPVEFVVCWTRDGCETEATRQRDTGGTATAIVMADRLGIPVYNLKNADALARFTDHVLALDRKFYPEGYKANPAQEVFVFGSNLAGRHGAGAALVAAESFGAIRGKGVGRMGQCYGIATKDGRNNADLKDPSQRLSLGEIAQNVAEFIAYAKANPKETFLVTAVACGLAGYKPDVIAPLFNRAPTNCLMPEAWRPWLGPQNFKLPPGPGPAVTTVVCVKDSPYDVYIGRKVGSEYEESIWGNPFKSGRDGTLEEVVAKYYEYARNNPKIMAQVHTLKGKRLGCWCKSKDTPDKLCHGDVLVALAAGVEWSLPPIKQASLF